MCIRRWLAGVVRGTKKHLRQSAGSFGRDHTLGAHVTAARPCACASDQCEEAEIFFNSGLISAALTVQLLVEHVNQKLEVTILQECGALQRDFSFFQTNFALFLIIVLA